jgi:hypothetical protein
MARAAEVKASRSSTDRRVGQTKLELMVDRQEVERGRKLPLSFGRFAVN